MPMLAEMNTSWPSSANGVLNDSSSRAAQLADHVVVGQVGHDDGELITAQSRHLRRRGVLAAAGPHPVRDLLHQAIAEAMAQRVVDPAEVVEVQEAHRQPPLSAGRCAPAPR